MTGEHCGHECVCGRFGITTFPYGSHCLANRDDDYDPCEYDTRGASHSSSPAAAPVPTGDDTQKTISSLISENARLGAELKESNRLVELFSGKHDEQIRQQAAAEEREKVLNEIMHWLEPQGLPLLKQRMWRQLESLRSGEGVQQR